MDAVVMAGGKGVRLHPYTATFPKPLVPLGDLPILEILLRQLRSGGITRVILAVNHLRHLIEAFCGDGSRLDLQIQYSVEEEPLGTAGPLAAVIDRVSDEFVVCNGDLLTTLDFHTMIEAHTSASNAATIAVYEREVKSDFGIVEVDSNFGLLRYLEKPTYKHLVSMGFYVLNREAVRPCLHPGKYLDMPALMRLLVAGERRVICHQQECFWLDIGRPEDYAAAQTMFAENRSMFLEK